MNGTQESFQLYKMDENVQITSGLEKKVLTKKAEWILVFLTKDSTYYF